MVRQKIYHCEAADDFSSFRPDMAKIDVSQASISIIDVLDERGDDGVPTLALEIRFTAGIRLHYSKHR